MIFKKIILPLFPNTSSRKYCQYKIIMYQLHFKLIAVWVGYLNPVIIKIMDTKWVFFVNNVQDAGLYLKDLVPPVLSCFYDQDSRVRYYACEALYNISKVARGSVLPFFNNIFDGLSKVSEPLILQINIITMHLS